MGGITKDQVMGLRFEAQNVFTPAAPINEKELFAGRLEQVGKVVDALAQRGQHVVVFGERGVGKTSLVNILAPWLQSVGKRIIAPRVNCDGSDTFSSMWKKMLDEIEMTWKTKRIGFGEGGSEKVGSLAGMLGKDDVSPNAVRKALSVVGGKGLLVVLIFDEFDRVQDKEIQRMFADTIKALSDYSVPVTIVLVGVADTVDQLIAEHESIERALVQTQMKRMPPTELEEIISKGLEKLNMSMAPDAKKHIITLSQGLPHYAHLLGLHATRKALDELTTDIQMKHVNSAIETAVDEAQQRIREAYRKATTSARKNNLYSDVILACAQAETDDLGYFAAANVREPLRTIAGRNLDIPNFSQHLHAFCEDSRGPVLVKTGVKHRYRFRFKNPLMQPFVMMRGYSEGKLQVE